MRDLKLPPQVRAGIDAAVGMLLEEFGVNVRRVVLFGSYAKNTYQPDSDVDLAVVLEDLPDPRHLMLYKQSLELDHMEIDLLFCSREQLASNKFVYRWINEQGVTVYEQL
ncbi:MAG: nucleotidyltransferase domain-containing protein [Defluviitaleaceae bacterium]|nr:nucleotidyltransferase domain-containing protein [Defluviitaleaceae bacterium]